MEKSHAGRGGNLLRFVDTDASIRPLLNVGVKGGAPTSPREPAERATVPGCAREAVS